MTDRIEGFVVTLEKCTRDDEVEHIINALHMTKGVLNVTPLIASPETYCAYERGVLEIRSKILELFRKELKF